MSEKEKQGNRTRKNRKRATCKIKREIRACSKRKDGLNDLNEFDSWFELVYRPINCGGMKVPKIISFKEHIRILKERDNEYDHLLDDYNKLVDMFNELQDDNLLNDYNELVDSFRKLQKAFYEATGEYYKEEE